MHGQRVLISLENTGHVITRLFVCTFIVSRIKKFGRKLPCLLLLFLLVFHCCCFLLDYKTERERERERTSSYVFAPINKKHLQLLRATLI